MTLTQEEWGALVHLLQRCPLTQAEAVWINSLLLRGQVQAAPPDPASLD